MDPNKPAYTFQYEGRPLEPQPVAHDPMFEYYYRKGNSFYFRNSGNKIILPLPDKFIGFFKRGSKYKIEYNSYLGCSAEIKDPKTIKLSYE